MSIDMMNAKVMRKAGRQTGQRRRKCPTMTGGAVTFLNLLTILQIDIVPTSTRLPIIFFSIGIVPTLY